MENAPETPNGEGEGKPNPLDKLFESPEVQQGIAEFIKQLPSVLQSWIKSNVDKETVRSEHQVSSVKWASQYTTGAMLLLTVIIVAAVSFLGWNGRMSSEAVAFLFGTIIGTAYGFLGRFFSSKS